MGTGQFNARAGGITPAMDLHPFQGGVEILLVASCYRTGISSGLVGHIGPYADFTFFYVCMRMVIFELT